MAADAVPTSFSKYCRPWSSMSWVISPMIVVRRWEPFLNPFSFARTFLNFARPCSPESFYLSWSVHGNSC
jgi:hypothetical protein